MNKEILSELRNKLTAPKIAIERLARGEKVPKEFLELAEEQPSRGFLFIDKNA